MYVPSSTARIDASEDLNTTGIYHLRDFRVDVPIRQVQSTGLCMFRITRSRPQTPYRRSRYMHLPEHSAHENTWNDTTNVLSTDYRPYM
ncbi:hypothetical protein J1614_001883 [Plenodomus biglobosus]|nr:hypothetical protein J1614_001883 [Plenodomus biglobosus]